MTENVPVRLGAPPLPRTEWFAKLEYPAWAIPTIDPYSYEDKHNFKGIVGRINANGFDPCLGNQEIAFFLGCCSGVFFAGEVVPVIKFPFNTQPLYHQYKWMARGLGQITAWTEKVGGTTWRIDDGPTITGGVLTAHAISESGESEAGNTGMPFFPGMPFPYARTPGQLSQKPVQRKWCGAEGLFTPIVQTRKT